MKSLPVRLAISTLKIALNTGRLLLNEHVKLAHSTQSNFRDTVRLIGAPPKTSTAQPKPFRLRIPGTHATLG